ncbi:Zinc finger, GATA-type [Corchorus olitorius]|uniref:Zinc finger, GATA-type n=1 Tax=Corchorus olitorius TaxID=93759 RepID=A0A1R3GZI1_9ROSI|nr:Zinc finger, GATA-type [Corchorus olitorius]
MDGVNKRGLLTRPYVYEQDNGGFEGEGFNGARQVVMNGMMSSVSHANGVGGGGLVQSTRTSELTIAFEGEVYVFPAVTSDKVKAVLLLLGGRDASTNVPSSEFLLQEKFRVVGDSSRGSKLSRRIASLVRFREKKKDRCYEKKIRYTCRKEVAQRMHRKNGQFASLKECDNSADGSWDQSDAAPESAENLTPAMRKGPAGPRTLCNACGLMWANKGTLRDLRKGGRDAHFDSNEPETPTDIKPSTMEPKNSFANDDEQESPEETKPLPLDSEDHLIRSDEQEFIENSHPFPIQVENSSVNLDDEDLQETLEELADASGSDFEIPTHFDEQVDIDDTNMGMEWPRT